MASIQEFGRRFHRLDAVLSEAGLVEGVIAGQRPGMGGRELVDIGLAHVQCSDRGFGGPTGFQQASRVVGPLDVNQDRVGRGIGIEIFDDRLETGHRPVPEPDHGGEAEPLEGALERGRMRHPAALCDDGEVSGPDIGHRRGEGQEQLPAGHRVAARVGAEDRQFMFPGHPCQLGLERGALRVGLREPTRVHDRRAEAGLPTFLQDLGDRRWRDCQQREVDRPVDRAD